VLKWILKGMKKITNKSKKQLVFPKLDFSISAGETKEVSDSIYTVLIRNSNIQIANNSIKKVDKIDKK